MIDSTAAGKLAAGILGVFNQFFSDSLSERTKYRVAEGVKQGNWLWIAPIGYLNADKSLIVDSERAPFVRKAFELVNEGHTSEDARHPPVRPLSSALPYGDVRQRTKTVTLLWVVRQVWSIRRAKISKS